MSDADSRATPRETAYVAAEIVPAGGAPCLGVMQDVSAHGIALLAGRKLEVGTAVDVAVQVEAERRVEVKGRVVRRTDHPHGPWRYRLAIELEEPSDALASEAARIHAGQSAFE
ncbi:MAG: PilZ domain-containing protein [Sandaracinaceae bacterium]